MRFLIHGTVPPEVAAALAKKEHPCHTLAELAAEMGADAVAPAENDPVVLLPLLDKRQWHLLTADAALVRGVYEKKVPYGGVIVLLLDDLDAAGGQGRAIERLFERYKRLTPGRLYTVTPNRVKIRQLPGAGAHRG